MSEVLRDIWTPEENLAYHQEMARKAHGIIDQNIVTDGNDEVNRFKLGFDTMLTGEGQKSTVLAMGPPGTVKTSFGNLVFGQDRQTSIVATDEESTLFGHHNPVNADEFIEGKFHDSRQLDPEDPVFFLNEISHKRNQRLLNALWDKQELEINGVKIPLEAAAFYMTSNFPDGNDVFELNEALKSRTAAELLTGDVSKAKAEEIQGFEPKKNGEAVGGPLLPRAAVRKMIARLVGVSYPDPIVGGNGETVVGNFTVDLVSKLNETGLVKPINAADKRIGQAMKSVTRAYMFNQELDEGKAITPFYAAQVAAFVMPTTVELNSVARSNARGALDRGLHDMEEAIAVRRLIARAAGEVLVEQHRNELQKQAGKLVTDEEAAQHIEYVVHSSSYASPEALEEDVPSIEFFDQAIAGKEVASDVSHTKPVKGKRHAVRKLLGRIPS